MREKTCAVAIGIVVVGGCAEPCVDDGINQEKSDDEQCAAVGGTETDSASASATGASTSVSATVGTLDTTASATESETQSSQTASSVTASDTDPDSGDSVDVTGEPGQCPVLDADLSMDMPTIVLLVDQSGSMEFEFDGDTRWNTVRNTLLDPDFGVVIFYQEFVRFGLTLYSNTEQDPACPELVEVAPMVQGYDAIAQAFDMANPADDTPTGDSVAVVAAQLAEENEPGDEIIVLVTDGEPDTCEQPDPENGQAESVAAVEGAYGMGVTTFVVSVGADISEDHLQDVANAGRGVQPGDPDAPFYIALDQASLAQAFTEILQSTKDCEFDLDAPLVDGGASSCVVEVNGQAVPLDDPNGWQTDSPNRIELLGDACDAIQTGEATVQMVCECDAVEGR